MLHCSVAHILKARNVSKPSNFGIGYLSIHDLKLELATLTGSGTGIRESSIYWITIVTFPGN